MFKNIPYYILSHFSKHLSKKVVLEHRILMLIDKGLNSQLSPAFVSDKCMTQLDGVVIHVFREVE